VAIVEICGLQCVNTTYMCMFKFNPIKSNEIKDRVLSVAQIKFQVPKSHSLLYVKYLLKK
jgi:hypothetical protein